LLQALAIFFHVAEFAAINRNDHIAGLQIHFRQLFIGAIIHVAGPVIAGPEAGRSNRLLRVVLKRLRSLLQKRLAIFRSLPRARNLAKGRVSPKR